MKLSKNHINYSYEWVFSYLFNDPDFIKISEPYIKLLKDKHKSLSITFFQNEKGDFLCADLQDMLLIEECARKNKVKVSTIIKYIRYLSTGYLDYGEVPQIFLKDEKVHIIISPRMSFESLSEYKEVISSVQSQSDNYKAKDRPYENLELLWAIYKQRLISEKWETIFSDYKANKLKGYIRANRMFDTKEEMASYYNKRNPEKVL
ncbi:hypothetical protein KDA00_01775 [Candidatus Saccharibacteria bacterium]|nr:hypothetical protein [Candidatus Saccharibacteria bacterium]